MGVLMCVLMCESVFVCVCLCVNILLAGCWVVGSLCDLDRAVSQFVSERQSVCGSLNSGNVFYINEALFPNLL